MTRFESQPGVPGPDTRAIRRRLDREDVIVKAPAVLDAAAADELLGQAVDGEDNVNVVVDLRSVERCDRAVLEVLVGMADTLNLDGLTLTLSHPSPAVERVLGSGLDSIGLSVRRPRTRRPLRRSMRGEVGQV